MQRKMLASHVPPTAYQAVRVTAAARGQTIAEFIRETVLKEVQKFQKKEKSS